MFRFLAVGQVSDLTVPAFSEGPLGEQQSWETPVTGGPEAYPTGNGGQSGCRDATRRAGPPRVPSSTPPRSHCRHRPILQ
jgi:hypothetical protein